MLLRTQQLTKDYGHFRALDSLDLEVRPGEICGILGPNGSGKSTALRLLMLEVYYRHLPLYQQLER